MFFFASAEDAEEAVTAGADGIIVSNLGGRSLDTAPATVNRIIRNTLTR